MRAIKIKYNGGDDTRILFREETTGKLLQTQKYLLNVATEKNTDAIFPERGTDLLRTALGGALITNNGVRDGFAAVDTLYFCNYEEAAEVFNSADNVIQFTLRPGNYRHATRQLSFAANFTFKDGTTYNTQLELANND
jgi:hypothetical protein